MKPDMQTGNEKKVKQVFKKQYARPLLLYSVCCLSV